MKKYVAAAALVAVGATASLAGPVGAQEGQPAPSITSFDATVSPKKSGKKKKPRTSKLRLALTVPAEARGTADQITFDIARKVKVNGKGFKRCSVDTLNEEGPTACPKGSEAGGGTATAAFGPRLTPIVFDVSAYVSGKKSMAFYLVAQGLPIQKAIPGEVTKLKKPFGQRVTITIPPDLQQQLGAWVYLTGLDATISAKKGKGRKAKSLISTRGCKKKKHPFEASVRFVPNPNPPAVETATAETTSSCR